MATVQTLYSGSSGNCTLLKDASTSILIDMGKSCKETVAALSSAGEEPENISAIFITHEHSDHISGLEVFLRRYRVPLFGSAATLEYLWDNALIPECDFAEVEPGQEILLGSVAVSGFRTSHDSVDCYGYRFGFENKRSAGLATDLGYVSEGVMENLSGCSFIGLESNYDEELLRLGPYPSFLKKRISSRSGHLSNKECAQALAMFAAKGTEKCLLMHLSERNNAPEYALTACLGMMENYGIDGCEVEVAPRHIAGKVIEV